MCLNDVFDIKSKIDDLTLTSTLAYHHFGEISAIEQADDFRCALRFCGRAFSTGGSQGPIEQSLGPRAAQARHEGPVISASVFL